MTGPGTSNPGAERHRILRELRQQIESHPAVERARGHPDGEYSEVTAALDPSFFGRRGESATLRMTWYPIPESQSAEIRPERPRTSFTFHYSEVGGYDCGFHNEPNPHVDGWFHFQERSSPAEAYEYVPAELEARTPPSAVWEMLDQLAARLQQTA